MDDNDAEVGSRADPEIRATKLPESPALIRVERVPTTGDIPDETAVATQMTEQDCAVVMHVESPGESSDVD